MQFVDLFLTNLQLNVDATTAKFVKSIQENFKEYIDKEEELLKKAFIDGYETKENAHSTKSRILSELYFKQNFK